MTKAQESLLSAEQIENIISIAQRLIKAEKEKSKITPTFISSKVKIASSMFEDEPPLLVAQQEKIVTILIQRFSHWIGKTTTLKDDVGHHDWLNSTRKQDWQYWRRYRDYQESKLSESVVEHLNEATDDILGLLEDPRRSDPWDRRGLVVGHVQSGKTSNYTGVICKAADAGYKIIIVLAGMHNNLRSQTQIRLEEGFLGYETTLGGDVGMPIGVAEFGDDLKTNSATTRAENGDFSKEIAKHFHGISPEERPWLFVVKKQKTVLTELLHWIKTRVTDSKNLPDGRKIVTKLPLLMIDDEADNASVDTGEQIFKEDGSADEEHQPKTINSLIRQILHSFSRKAYIGYTATPFANIFIHHKGVTATEGPDLFPKSFIINLAAPSNYVGPARMFGRLTKNGRVDGLPLFRDINDHYDPDLDSGWMPHNHGKDHVPFYDGKMVIPPSLRRAIYSFVLACATRELRGQNDQHCSMLIHVTRYVDVQKHVCNQVREALVRMSQRLTRGIDDDEILTELRKLWEEDFLPTRDRVAELSSSEDRSPNMPKWDEIKVILPNIIEDIKGKVRSINGKAKDALDYSTRGVALKVIAIGGDKLSRGLTLEGLCTSYFVRTTKMYDTLMQMGRWFGYRPGYLDLCRLYTSSDLITWFCHIADASEELRDEFDFMAEAKLTPEQYGLKVMSHEVLTVTSPLKMRNSRKLSLSYSATRPQTILFHRNAKIQQKNLDATDTLISSLGSHCLEKISYARDGGRESWPHAHLWKDVEVSKVLKFLDEYVTHPRATSAKAALLSEFIIKMVRNGQLKKWSIALLGGGNGSGDEHTFPGGISLTRFSIRKIEDSKAYSQMDPASFAIGVLTEPKDEGIDLNDDVWRTALKLTRNVWKADASRGRHEEPSFPSGKAIRETRGKLGGDSDRGLLLLYPLTPYLHEGKKQGKLIVSDWSKPVMAFAIAFPSSKDPISVEYEVNLLYWSQEYGPSE